MSGSDDIAGTAAVVVVGAGGGGGGGGGRGFWCSASWASSVVVADGLVPSDFLTTEPALRMTEKLILDERKDLVTPKGRQGRLQCKRYRQSLFKASNITKPRVYPCQNALWSHFSNHYPLYTLVFVITAPLYMRCRIINHIKLLESVAAKHIYNAIS